MVDTSTLPVSELEQILENYPWFTAARVDFLFRQLDTDPEALRTAVKRAGIFFQNRKEFNRVVERRIAGEQEQQPVPEEASSDGKKPKSSYYVVGGDYFSKEDFRELEEQGLAVETPSFDAAHLDAEGLQATPKPAPDAAEDEEIISETLAGIFAEQLFYQRAIDIYKKLILLYPEKSAYFASLIEKLENLKQK